MERIAQTNIMDIIFLNFGIDFDCFLEALGMVFLLFCALEPGLTNGIGFCSEHEVKIRIWIAIAALVFNIFAFYRKVVPCRATFLPSAPFYWFWYYVHASHC